MPVSLELKLSYRLSNSELVSYCFYVYVYAVFVDAHVCLGAAFTWSRFNLVNWLSAVIAAVRICDCWIRMRIFSRRIIFLLDG